MCYDTLMTNDDGTMEKFDFTSLKFLRIIIEEDEEDLTEKFHDEL